MIDGPLAPFGDAEHLRELISRDASHRALYKVFLAVRNSASRILESTTRRCRQPGVARLQEGIEEAEERRGERLSAAAPVPDRIEIPGLARARS